jgi:hypothetical protein
MAKKTPKNLFAMSTSTFGGAVIMALLSMLLGDKAPWLYEKISASAKGIGSVSLSVDDIFDHRSINDIDTQVNYVDAQSKFYLKKPLNDQWGIETANPGRVLDDISVAYVPFFRYSFSLYSLMFNLGTTLQDDITTTTFSSRKATYSIDFGESTSIAGFPLRLNPFEDIDFVKNSMRMGGSILQLHVNIDSLLDESTQSGREFLENSRQQMVQQGREIIDKDWPASQTFSDNLTVTTFRLSVLSRNPTFKLLIRNSQPNILTVLNFLTFSNPELALFNVNHIDVSKNNDAVMIDGTITITDITVNRTKVENCQLVRFVLVALKNNTIYVVTMRYLYGFGSSFETKEELGSLFRSFRVIG